MAVSKALDSDVCTELRLAVTPAESAATLMAMLACAVARLDAAALDETTMALDSAACSDPTLAVVAIRARFELTVLSAAVTLALVESDVEVTVRNSCASRADSWLAFTTAWVERAAL